MAIAITYSEERSGRKMTPGADLLTVVEGAETLRCHPATVRRLIAEEKLPGTFKVGRAYRIPLKALETLSRGAIAAVGTATR
jgi:excisionase family DNA binding protein